MATYERSTRIDAPLEEVWDFHSRVSGLEAVTPPWLNLRVEAVMGPDGERDPDILEEDAEISLSIRPFGVGPRVYWTSIILERDSRPGRAYFSDEMVHGPFANWVHTHSFFADGEQTVLRDKLEYALPGGGLGEAVSPFSRFGFEGMFRDRHRRTKRALE
ncbi:SRPBCC family protein [Saliphagus sp. GCM10025334]